MHNVVEKVSKDIGGNLRGTQKSKKGYKGKASVKKQSVGGGTLRDSREVKRRNRN